MIAAGILILLFSSSTLLDAASFNESCRADDRPCPALLAYTSSALHSTISTISTLFPTTPGAILAANSFSPTTNTSTRLPVGETLRIPVPCPCVNGQRSGEVVYTVVPQDFLFQIASRYSGLVTVDELVAANRISNPDQIQVGQNLTIPYPCSCRGNSFAVRDAVFMSYAIREGENPEGFLSNYNLTAQEFQQLNPSVNTSQAGAVIQLPVPVCRAQFSPMSLDANLTVVSGGYALTANGCVQCSCDGTELHCTRAPSAPRSCATSCSNPRLELGNFTTSPNATGGCTVQSCLYNGYNQTQVLTRIERDTTTNTCSEVQPPPTFAFAPEQQGIPEAIAPNSGGSPPTVPGGSAPSGPGRTAPAPDTGSAKITAPHFLTILLASVILYNV